MAGRSYTWQAVENKFSCIAVVVFCYLKFYKLPQIPSYMLCLKTQKYIYAVQTIKRSTKYTQLNRFKKYVLFEQNW